MSKAMDGRFQLSEKEPDISVGRLILALRKHTPKKWIHTVSKRASYGAAFVLKGRAVYITEEGRYPVEKNHVLFFREGSSYRITVDDREGFEFVVVSFDIPEKEQAVRLPIPPALYPSDPLILRQHFLAVHKSWNVRTRGYTLACRIHILSILLELISGGNDRSKKPGALPSGIEEACGTMQRDYPQKLDMDKLARDAGYSASHFRSVFKKATGLPPVAYLMKIRIERACELLSSELLTVTEVAEATGFSNVYYFSKAFKNHTGSSPGLFRRKDPRL